MLNQVAALIADHPDWWGKRRNLLPLLSVSRDI